MAWSQRKQNRKWKGIKWIDSPFANHYKLMKAMNRIQLSGIISSGMIMLNQISAASVYTSADKTNKSLAKAATIINTCKATLNFLDKRTPHEMYNDPNLHRNIKEV